MVSIASSVRPRGQVVLLDRKWVREGYRSRTQVRWMDTGRRSDGGTDGSHDVARRRCARACSAHTRSPLLIATTRERFQPEPGNRCSSWRNLENSGVGELARESGVLAESDGVDSGGTTEQCCRSVYCFRAGTHATEWGARHPRGRRRHHRRDTQRLRKRPLCVRFKNDQLHDLWPGASFRRSAYFIG